MSQAIIESRKIADQIESGKIPPPSRAQAVTLIRQMVQLAERLEAAESERDATLARIAELERENAELRSTEFAAQQQVFDLSHKVQNLESSLAKSASREAALVEALKLSEAVLAATQEVYGACLGPKTHEGINAALAKIKETTC